MFKVHLNNFLNYLRVGKNASANTLKSYSCDLIHLYNYFKSKHGIAFNENAYWEYFNNHRLREYMVFLYENDLSRATIARRISALRSFVKFLCREGVLETNPFTNISSPRKVKRLPRFLYPSEINALLEKPDISHPLGKRDRMILEVLYATGIRVSELVGINLEDLDIQQSCIKIRGKGEKERIVLLGQNARKSIESYLVSARKDLLKNNLRENALVLNQKGKRLTARSVRNILNKYVEQAALKHKISPHIIRHTFATHLLNGGADLRSVQKLLGHERLSTTQIYTHLTKENLKAIHNKSHPRR